MGKDIVAEVMNAIHLAGFVEIEVSAKHVHLSQEHVEVLFGKGTELTPVRPLSQPGQFLSNQRVTIRGPKRAMERVAVLGPVRGQTQVELSKSDAVALGIKDIPIRESGDLKHSAPIIIEGPCGTVNLTEGAIIALKHIHVTAEDSVLLNLKDKETVSVEVYSERPVIFKDVLIRVSKDYSCKMHVDFDEANAAAIEGFTLGRIIRKLDVTGVEYQK